MGKEEKNNRERNGEEREKRKREMEKKKKVGEKHLREVELNTGQWLSGMASVRKVVNQHTHRRRIT